MRILFLCHRQHDVTIGGVAEFIHFLPLALKKLGITSIVYTQSELSSQTLLGPVSLNNGVSCYSGPFVKPSWFSSHKKLAPLLQLCEKEKIDLIHAQGLYRSGYLAMQIHQHTNIPYIITSHSDILAANSDRIKRVSVQRRCRRILKHAAHVTHLTSFMADASHDIFETSEKSQVIGNGIDIAGWKSFTNSPEKNYLFAIGRLEPEKGFHVLIDTYAKLRDQGIKSSLVIAGTGSAEKKMHEQTKNLGLNLITDFQNYSAIPESSVVFTGYVRGEIKKQLMAESQLVLFPTQPHAWEEPFGIVQIEAMAAGKPLVSSDTNSTRYLQQLGLQAHVVPPTDTHAWAKEISHLLENAELRKKLGEKNWEHAQQFDWEKVAEQYAQVYKIAQSKQR